MGGFASGDGGAMPPGPPPSGGNFYNNFFNQDGMPMEGVVQEGESEFHSSN